MCGEYAWLTTCAVVVVQENQSPSLTTRMAQAVKGRDVVEPVKRCWHEEGKGASPRRCPRVRQPHPSGMGAIRATSTAPGALHALLLIADTCAARRLRDHGAYLEAVGWSL